MVVTVGLALVIGPIACSQNLELLGKIQTLTVRTDVGDDDDFDLDDVAFLKNGMRTLYPDLSPDGEVIFNDFNAFQDVLSQVKR